MALLISHYWKNGRRYWIRHKMSAKKLTRSLNLCSWAKDVYYDLSEGEKQDDIEVMHIDEKAGLVAFKNHRITQKIALAVESSGGINNIGNSHNNKVGFGQLSRRANV